jgi:DNA-binding XRE family transcriptional regulator
LCTNEVGEEVVRMTLEPKEMKRAKRQPPAMATRSDKKPASVRPEAERNKHRPKSLYPLPGLRNARLAMDITQSELGRRSGISQVSISALEWQDRDARRGTADKLARGLGVQTQDIMAGGRFDPGRKR